MSTITKGITTLITHHKISLTDNSYRVKYIIHDGSGCAQRRRVKDGLFVRYQPGYSDIAPLGKATQEEVSNPKGDVQPAAQMPLAYLRRLVNFLKQSQPL